MDRKITRNSSSWQPSSQVQTRRQLQTESQNGEELHQFDRLQVWELVDKPFGKNEEGIDFKESFAQVARLEIHKDGDGDALFKLKSDSLPHAHAQTTKTYYKHRDSRIMKAQELKTKTSAQTLIYKIFLQRYQVYQGRLLASVQDDAKYDHVGQDTRSQGGNDDQDGRIKI
ncbi:hypothetical protein Tco_0008331 [Tanacetum coccineum]